MPKSDSAQQQLFQFTPSPFEPEEGGSEDDLLGDEELLSESHLSESHLLVSKLDQTDRADALLDESSLETILDMLAVMNSIEELMLLETLTADQKRQVWAATPETIRSKLKQIREAGFSESGHWQNLAPLGDSNQPVLSIGNQVVLIAKPKLTAAELIAIWEVMEVHEGYARIRAKNLGVRNYPVSWMVDISPAAQISSDK